MIVALMGDVHGNLPALEKVLADARARGAEAFWHLGDFVGYGPFPEEVVDLLRNAPDVISIAGNYDLRVLKLEAQREKWRVSKSPEKFFALEWAHDSLSPQSRDYLATLPTTRRIQVEGHAILLTHGSPEAVDEALSPTTPESRLHGLAELARADMVACGHSHQAFARSVNGTLFVNPGGCGRPEGYDTRTCYALLHLDSNGIGAEIVRVEYDIRRTVEAMRAKGFPDAFVDMVALGRKLNGAAPPATALDACREAVMALARSCDYEVAHTHQVCRIALDLFDELKPLHGLGEADRFLLEWGALLHDIGWVEGRRAHHKAARRIILDTTLLPLDGRERAIVGLIARYHRKAEPRDNHAGFQDLAQPDQRRVRVLAGLLRVADGLDRGHRSVVARVACEVGGDGIRVLCQVKSKADLEAWGASRKAGLIEKVFARPWVFDMIEGD